MDLASFCGFPLSGYSTSKVLWTFQGRFRLTPRAKVGTAIKSAGTTDAFLSATMKMKRAGAGTSDDGEEEEQHLQEPWPYLVRQEASELVATCKKNNTFPPGIMDQAEQVADCFLYMLEMGCRGRRLIDYDLATHSASYWMCDDIIQHQDHDDALWRAAEALHCEIRLDTDHHQYVPPSQLVTSWKIEQKPYWTSPTYGVFLVPTGALPHGGMFQHHLDKLRVLKLSRCTFNFQSPPFICCHSLRFLWLDHCQGTSTADGAEKEEEEHLISCCFQSLWVLDLRYTECDQILSAQMLDLMTQLRELNVMGARGWDMGQLRGRLANIRKLRVRKSKVSCSCSENELFSKMNKLKLLDFSGNETVSPMKSIFGPGVSSIDSGCCLETVIVLDGAKRGLEHISFTGCTKLKNLLLGGIMGVLRTLDISGTAVKTLDLSTTTINFLDELYLLDCEKLCAILWPPEDKMGRRLAKLCIDTTLSSAPTATQSTGTSLSAQHGSRQNGKFDWYVSVRDAIFLVSLEPVYSSYRAAYVEVSPHPSIAAGGSEDQGIKGGSSSEQQNLQRQPAPAIYTDTMDHLQQASEGDGDAGGIMCTWPCPDVPHLQGDNCYMHIHDQTRTKLQQGGEDTSPIAVPGFVFDCAKILHVHDSLSVNILPTGTKDLGSEWHRLEWCRIERCPKLDYCFTSGEEKGGTFLNMLRSLWASQLLRARYIWRCSEELSKFCRVFPNLTFLHVDWCPRLVHVLPLPLQPAVTKKPIHTRIPAWVWPDYFYSCQELETLEIMWCGDLREVFPSEEIKKGRFTVYFDFETAPFRKLKRIHLYELPSLRHIYRGRMSTPNLETVKIRGCWSLRHLPDVSGNKKIVECDCEKEWWDRLEWDNGSQRDHYKPIHSRYYKKTLLRGSVLR